MSNERVALVTGANQGIGFQVAKELVAHNWTVWLGVRDSEKGQAAACRIGERAVFVPLDVTETGSIAAAADRIRAEHGRLDLLVNNAAISRPSHAKDWALADYMKTMSATTISLDDMRALWETNVFALVAVTQAMLPLLRAAPAARIVNVGSGAGSLTLNADPAFPYRTMYSPGYAGSKTAMNVVTLSFAIELASEGIRVNSVSPGFTSTNLNNFEGTESVEEGSREVVRVALLEGRHPQWHLHRLGERTDPVVRACRRVDDGHARLRKTLLGPVGCCRRGGLRSTRSTRRLRQRCCFCGPRLATRGPAAWQSRNGLSIGSSDPGCAAFPAVVGHAVHAQLVQRPCQIRPARQ